VSEEKKETTAPSGFLDMKKIQEIVEEIITKGRSLYNNDPKCYTKGRGVDDNAFMHEHCTRKAIEEMITEKLEGVSVNDILAILSFSMLHYYIIKVERWEHFLYPDKDRDKITLQQAFKGKVTEEGIHEFAEHVLYFCCRIYYYALVEKKRIDKENRKKEEEKLNNTGSKSATTGVQSSTVTYTSRNSGNWVNGAWHHQSCQCEACKAKNKPASVGFGSGGRMVYPL
jgi:hypothetical protein